MNGSLPDLDKIVNGGGAVLGHPEVIGLLEQALVQAKGGRLVSVGIVTVEGPGRVSAAAAGGLVAEINLGCDLLKGALLANATGRPSRIIGRG